MNHDERRSEAASRAGNRPVAEEVSAPPPELMFRALFENALEAFVIADDGGRYLDVNPAACILFGLPREELVGRHVSEFAVPAYAVEHEWRSFRSNSAQRGDFALKRPDGEVRETEYQAVADFLPGQHLSVLRDVTERRQAEREREAALVAIGERVKEATLLQEAGRLLGRGTQPLGVLLQALVDLIPLAWQYPSLVAARLEFDGAGFESEDFRESGWSQDVSFATGSGREGSIAVSFREQPPVGSASSPLAPFLQEEARTLATLAGMLTAELERREAAERLLFQAQLLDSVREAVIALDNDFRITYWGKGAEAIYDYPGADVLGRPYLDVARPLARAVTERRLARVAQSERWMGQDRHRRKDGTIFWIEASIAPIRDARGRRRGLVGVARDITLRRQHESRMEAIAFMAQALRSALAREEVLSAALDALLDQYDAAAIALAVADEGTGAVRIERSQGRWPEPTGFTRNLDEGITGRVLRERTPYYSEDLAQEEGFLNAAAFSDERWAAACLPLLAAAGRPVGALWLVRQAPFAGAERHGLNAAADMLATALHRASLYERLRRQAARFQRMVNTLGDGLVLLDEDDRILLANPAAIRFLKLLNGQAQIGQPLAQLGSRSLAEVLAAAGRHRVQEFQLAQPELQVFEVGVKAISNRPASPGHVLVIRNVTESRQAERQRRRHEGLAAVGQMAAGIAHDFNNVLASLRLYTDLLTAEVEPAHRRRMLATMQQQTEFGSKLVQQLLDFSRGRERALAPMTVVPLCQEVVERWRQILPAAITVELDAGGSFLVNADRAGMQQILNNLIGNARDALAGAGAITVRLAVLELAPDARPPLAEMAPGRWLQLEVADTGEGMPIDIQEQIFNPFFSTKPAGTGTGLGLSQVFGIVRQYGGQITVTSAPGAGTAFQIFLPLLEGAG